MQKYIQLSILQTLQFLVWGTWFVTAGTYMLQSLHFSGREVGFVYATTSLSATISPLVLGVIADRFISVERLLSILHFVGAILLYWLSQINEFNLFLSVMMAYMICYLPTFSLTSSYCFHHIKDVKNDFPKIRVWGTIAWIIAGILVSYLDIEDTSVPFVIACGFSLLLSVYCLFLPVTPIAQKSPLTKKTLFGPELLTLFKAKSFSILIIALGLICIPLSFYYSFVNPFLNEVGIANAAGKMSIGQMAEIIVMLSLPWFFKNLNFKIMIFIGLLAWGVRYGLFAYGFNHNLEWIIIVGIALHGIAYVFSMLSAQIYIDTIVPNHLRSTAQGFFTLITMGIMALIGTFIAGELVNTYTYSNATHNWAAIWQFPFWFGIVVSIVFLFLFKSDRQPDQL
ncbi:MAG: MFS transporter [Saprospiraceae bacterium]